MKVVILCGGLGTRLREETEFRPKPMINIGDRPILWHVMKIYAQFGHTEFVLPLGYQGNMIRDYFVNYELFNNDVTLELGKKDSFTLHTEQNEAGWKVTMSDTGLNTLKGARLKRVEQYIDSDTFMLTYGDGVAKIDIDALLKFHQSHGKIATVTGVSPTARFGEIKWEGDQVREFHEKSSQDACKLINGGFFVFNRRVFDYLTPDPECDLEYGPLERIARDGELMVYRHTGFWACMDTFRDTQYLNGLWDKGEAEWKTW